MPTIYALQILRCKAGCFSGAEFLCKVNKLCLQKRQDCAHVTSRQRKKAEYIDIKANLNMKVVVRSSSRF